MSSPLNKRNKNKIKLAAYLWTMVFIFRNCDKNLHRGDVVIYKEIKVHKMTRFNSVHMHFINVISKAIFVHSMYAC